MQSNVYTSVLIHCVTGQEDLGLHDLVVSSVRRADANERRMLYGNVVLSGGSTAFDNLPERLQAELSRLMPIGTNVCS